MFGFNLNKRTVSHSYIFEVVGRGIETQLQVGKNSKFHLVLNG